VAFIASCRAVLVSGTHLAADSPRAACELAAQAARAAGNKVILDIDYRPVLWGLAGHAEGAARSAHSETAASRIGSMLPLCDLVVGTEEEFQLAGFSRDLERALANVRARTRALLVVKRGARGCVAFDGPIPEDLESGTRSEAFGVEVFNALGAGDAFMAGFLSGWLHGEPLHICCRLANACGALVVSRHGCSPAMPTAPELRHFLERGSATPRLREDAELEHVHRATTRAPVPMPLFVLAFDHRTQLEALAAAHGAAPERIAQFKSLVADAFLRVARGLAGAGVILDDRYGSGVLHRLTAAGAWIARPIESPGQVPLEFEAGDSLGLEMRSWPPGHVAKCLVTLHPDDPALLRERQTTRLRQAGRACAATGHELMVEVIAPAASPSDAYTMGRALERIYAAGVKPDWWKLPPRVDAESWRNVSAAIERCDPHCRGVLVLGMEASAERLRESFAAARASLWVRGFAVGRSIFAAAAEGWFGGKLDDAQAVDDVARRYEEVISLWEERDRRRHTA
jgi:5-dehydro-2-deoxygluconokinase